jgi:hypothetical protein
VQRRVNSVAERHLLHERSICELQEQGNLLQPCSQCFYVAETADWYLESTREYSVSFLIRGFSHINPFRFSRVGDRNAENPRCDQSRTGRCAMKKWLQVLRPPHIVDNDQGTLAFEFLRHFEHGVVLAIEAGTLAGQRGVHPFQLRNDVGILA